MERVIGVAIFDDAQILDIAAPLEIFRSANVELSERDRVNSDEQDYRVLVFGSSRGTSRTSCGLHIVATHEYGEITRQAVDTLVVVGGLGANPHCPADLVQFVAAGALKARRIVALGSGTFVLAQAGLLGYRQATTHWRTQQSLAKAHPDVCLVANRRLVKDSNVYTAAGNAASLELCLRLVQEDLGADIAASVAFRKLMSPNTILDEVAVGDVLNAHWPANRRIRQLARWVAQNPRREFSVELLASHGAMSTRTLARLFRRELGVSPSKFVEKVRLEIARQLLETSDISMQSAASQSGFGNEERMRRAFRRAYGKSPSAYVETYLAFVRPKHHQSDAASRKGT